MDDLHNDRFDKHVTNIQVDEESGGCYINATGPDGQEVSCDMNAVLTNTNGTFTPRNPNYDRAGFWHTSERIEVIKEDGLYFLVADLELPEDHDQDYNEDEEPASKYQKARVCLSSFLRYVAEDENDLCWDEGLANRTNVDLRMTPEDLEKFVPRVERDPVYDD